MAEMSEAPPMYSADQIRKGLRRTLNNPAYLGRELNRLYHRRLNRWGYNRRGVDVLAESWDNLLILDACRYDDFADLHDLPGDLQSRISRGSHTLEFLRGNFAGREMLDTVYVTASPQFRMMGIDARFHAIDDVWEGEGWDDDAGTVRPETVADRALHAAERYPNKRLVVHFVQPHYPFIGEDLVGGDLRDPGGIDVWGELMQGTLDADPESIRAAYRRNLDRALPSVERLLSSLDGKTVVSADHGNLFHERTRPVPVRDWGHPPGLHVDQLVRVPWLVYGEERRQFTAEEPADTERSRQSDPKERLRQLGYLE